MKNFTKILLMSIVAMFTVVDISAQETEINPIDQIRDLGETADGPYMLLGTSGTDNVKAVMMCSGAADPNDAGVATYDAVGRNQTLCYRYKRTSDNTMWTRTGITDVWVQDATGTGDGGNFTQDNTGGNIPGTLADPTDPAAPIPGDQTLQQYDDGVVISNYNGAAWVNTSISFLDGVVTGTSTPLAAAPTITLPVTPIAGKLFDLYRNGIHQRAPDYTIAGAVVTPVLPVDGIDTYSWIIAQ